MKSILYIASLVFAIIAIGTLSYNYISTEPTTNVITKSSDTNNTGIKVNGEWELTVYNKDGSIEEKHEFTNDLHPEGGPILLVGLLTGGHPDKSKYPLYWRAVINLDNSLSCPMVKEDGSYDFADITRTSDSFTISNSCQIISDNNQSQIPQQGYMKNVQTQWWYNVLSEDGEPSTEGITVINTENGKSGPMKTHSFTSKTFASNSLAVTEGQSIAVNVKISFD